MNHDWGGWTYALIAVAIGADTILQAVTGHALVAAVLMVALATLLLVAEAHTGRRG